MAKKKTIEELTKEIMIEMEKDGEPVTEEEAREMAQMELGAKELKNYTTTEKTKNRKAKSDKPRTTKVSEEKKQLFNDILNCLSQKYDIEVVTENKLLLVKTNGKEIKVDLVESRAKKK